MVTKAEYEKAKEYTLSALKSAGIALTQKEQNEVEVADFGLNRLSEIGLQLITYVNTDRCCSKELVLMPYQICPEHRHPEIDGKPGKEETFRCRKGEVFLYVEGEAAKSIKAKLPETGKENFTVFNEIVLKPGEQYTLKENTLHWFSAGPNGCIVSEFSTKSIDEADIFTDPDIKRAPLVES